MCWARFVFVALLAACTPVIAHTPRVERGTHFSLSEALGVAPVGDGSDSSNRRLLVFPTFVVREAMGFRSQRDADGSAFELGGELIFPTGVLSDAYYQFPNRVTGATDLGLGVAGMAGAIKGPMAYVQAGRLLSNNHYVFTTQAVGRFMRTTGNVPTRGRSAVTWWQPTIAIEPPDPTGRIRYFFVSATIGHTYDGCREVIIWGCTGSPGAMFSIGAAAGPRSRGGAPRTATTTTTPTTPTNCWTRRTLRAAEFAENC